MDKKKKGPELVKAKAVLFAMDSSSTYTFKLSPGFAVSNHSTKMTITSVSCARNCLMCGTAWILHTQLNMVTQ